LTLGAEANARRRSHESHDLTVVWSSFYLVFHSVLLAHLQYQYIDGLSYLQITDQTGGLDSRADANTVAASFAFAVFCEQDDLTK
jgi:hypothetical protein